MEVVGYEPAMLSVLASVYNGAVTGVPHCYPVSEETFAEGLAGTLEDGSGRGRLDRQEVLVARDAGAAVGFAHWVVGRIGDEEGDQGIVRFLWYERGRRRAGQALLDAVERALVRHGVTRVQAFPQECVYPFHHAANAYLSDRLDHVQALLAMAGYRRTRGEVFLDWPDFEPRRPGPAEVGPEITVQREEKPGRRPDLNLVARLGGETIGVCHSGSMAARAGGAAADEWVFTHWLGVEDEYRGKGLGRHLLRRALREARELGYRHAGISTDRENHRALVFYSNFGYRVVDWTYGFGRELGQPVDASR